MIDTTSLFLHVLAAVGILGGAAAQILAGQRLRAATDTAEVVTWASFMRTLGLLITASVVVSFLTGGHLAGAVWTTEESSGFSQPFITLGVAALVLLVPVGPMVGGRQLRGVITAAESGDASADALQTVRSNTVLWGAVHSLVGVGIGLVALMVYKPGWVVGAALLLISFAAGWTSGVVVSGRSTAAPSRPAGRVGR